MKDELDALLAPHGQQHLLGFWDQLDQSGRQSLAAQIRQLDFALIDRLWQGKDDRGDMRALLDRASPPPAFRLNAPGPEKGTGTFCAKHRAPTDGWSGLSGKRCLSPFPDRAEARAHGNRALAAGQVGVILVAGGQGTRLGFDHPKGMFPIGPVSGHSLFQIHVEKVLAAGGPRPRLRVEHAQILAPADIPRFARLGVVPSMQPTHCTSDMRWAGDRLGPERLEGAYAWRSVLDSGAYIAGGSDFPVEDANPFHGIHAAVTRRPREGDDPGWQPAQRMTREEAVRSFTVWNARSIGREADHGSLEPGKRADLIALSDDVFTCVEEKIAGITPTLTMVGGEVVAGTSAAG